MMTKNADFKGVQNANMLLWLVSCRIEIDNPDLSNLERKSLQNERTRIHKDLRTKFQCKQLAHSVKHMPRSVSNTSLWAVSSEKAKEGIEKARVQWNENWKTNGHFSSVEIFPVVTSKEGCEALEWMAKKREHNCKNHCRSRRDSYGD